MYILVVEEDKTINHVIKSAFEEQGYTCTCAYDGKNAADLIEKYNYDLVLLDIMIPKIDGYELLKYIKEIADIPTIFIIAKNQIQDKIRGIREGADDYITKPFEIDELIARVEAVLKRYNKTSGIIQIEDIEVNIASRVVKKHQVEVDLTPKEFDLLVLMLQNRNVALYRETIFEKIWGVDLKFETRTVDLHIQRLRKKLKWRNKIKTVYKIGYMLEI